MAELNDMLNGILSNPQAMQQIMALAQSMGLQGQNGPPQQAAPAPSAVSTISAAGPRPIDSRFFTAVPPIRW